MALETSFPDFYAVLEIQFGASDAEIRRAWMQLVKQWQSKANSGDLVATERLQQINVAYEVLSNPEERIKYDTAYEHQSKQPQEDPEEEIPDEPADCKSCLCGLIVIVAALAIVGFILWGIWTLINNVWGPIF